jgi:hypothetical protein
MNEAAPIDYASSPTLSTIREVAGDAAVVKLIAARGGTWVHLPVRLTQRAELVRLVGVDAAQRIVDRFGARTLLRIPTGRGHGHGRRLDHGEIVRLNRAGWSVPRLARAFHCTDRQVWNILANAAPDARQPGLL